MKGLETGKEKIQKICDALKKETLEPAKQEAREIVENAHLQAADILKEAKAKAESMLQEAELAMEEKKRIFQASFNLACRQGIEELKQKIEKELFNQELCQWVKKEMSDPKFIAHLLSSFIKTIEEKGIDEELIAKIPQSITPKIINEQLASRVLEKLHNKTVVAAEIGGGVQIQLKGRQITVDISDTAVRELLAQYIRRDLREQIFNV